MISLRLASGNVIEGLNVWWNNNVSFSVTGSFSADSIEECQW